MSTLSCVGDEMRAAPPIMMGPATVTDDAKVLEILEGPDEADVAADTNEIVIDSVLEPSRLSRWFREDLLRAPSGEVWVRVFAVLVFIALVAAFEKLASRGRR